MSNNSLVLTTEGQIQFSRQATILNAFNESLNVLLAGPKWKTSLFATSEHAAKLAAALKDEFGAPEYAFADENIFVYKDSESMMLKCEFGKSFSNRGIVGADLNLYINGFLHPDDAHDLIRSVAKVHADVYSDVLDHLSERKQSAEKALIEFYEKYGDEDNA